MIWPFRKILTRKRLASMLADCLVELKAHEAEHHAKYSPLGRLKRLRSMLDLRLRQERYRPLKQKDWHALLGMINES